MENPIRLLLVEDNPDEAEVLTLELERSGLSLEWSRVDNERDLRQKLTSGTWDLIISDFSMPRFDGLNAFRMARELSREVPFIFVSGALGEERAVQAMRAGARDYILKTELDRLPEAVRRELSPSSRKKEESQELGSLTDADLGTLGQLAHDFNNLFAVIISYGRFAQSGLDEGSAPYADVQKILEAAKNANTLTGRLLSISQRKREFSVAGDPTPVDPKERE